MNDHIASGHLKGYQDRFEDEKVPASLPMIVNKRAFQIDWGSGIVNTHSESKSFGPVPSCETNEWRRNRQIGHHLGHTQRHGQDDRTPQSERDEKTSRSASEQPLSDLDVQCRANSAADTAIAC
jgi:hypothetical protein